LPTIEGIHVPLSQQSTRILPAKPAPSDLPLLTSQDLAKFMGIFQASNPTNGLVTGVLYDIFKLTVVLKKTDRSASS
jgi:hypothetical protein